MGGVDSERMRHELSGLATVEERVERSSHILMELTRNVGIAAAMPALAQELDQIELVPLGDSRVLVILVTRDRIVRNRVLALDEPVRPEEPGIHSQLHQSQFQRMAVGRGPSRTAAAHGGGTCPV